MNHSPRVLLPYMLMRERGFQNRKLHERDVGREHTHQYSLFPAERAHVCICFCARRVHVRRKICRKHAHVSAQTLRIICGDGAARVAQLRATSATKMHAFRGARQPNARIFAFVFARGACACGGKSAANMQDFQRKYLASLAAMTPQTRSNLA